MAGIGDIGVRVAADITQFTSGMDRVAQIAETSMRRAEQAQRIATAASDKFVASLKYQADTFGKTDVEILKYKANLLGASEAAAPLIARLEQLNAVSGNISAGEGIKRTAHEMEQVGFKTAGAKRELLVLAHELSQGNFSRFGGSLLVLGERTGAAALLFSAAGLAAIGVVATLGAFAVAAFKGAAQSDALGKSLQLTGNYAGITEGQFNSIAHAAAMVENISIGKARDSFAALAATGQFTSASIDVVGTAALAMAKNTGAAAEDVAKEFAKMADGVTKYADVHNKQYHFLTVAQYEHIRTLEDEGQKQLAMVETGQALIDHFKSQVTNLGYLEHAWNGLKTAASGAWDQMLGLGRTFTVDDKLAQVNEKIRRASENVGGMTGMNPQAAKQYMNGLLAEKSQFENERNRIELRASEKSIELQVQDAGLKASRDLKDFGERYASKKQQAAKEIKLYTDAIAARMAAGKGGVDSEQMQQEMIAKIREKYAVKAKRDPKDDPAKKKLDGDLKEQQDGIAAEGKLLQSREAALQYYVGLEFMTQTEALESKKRFIAESLAATELAFDKEVGFLKAREVGAARAVDKQDAQNKLADVAAKRAAAEVDANGKIGKSQQELEGIQRSFSLQNEEIARLDEKANVAARFQIDLLGQSTIEVLKQNEARKIELALEEKIRQEKKRDANYDASDATTEAAIQTLKAQALIVEGYEKQRTAIFGASEAMRKYGEDAGNSALQIENTMASAFKSAEDAFVQFTMTGKISFASLAQSIIAEIARIQAKKAIAGLVDLATGFFSGSAYTGGAISGADGSQFSATGADIQGRHARGGAVGTYGNFLVGEEGPEILRMGGTSGSIIPNDKLGGGAVTVINNFNGDGSSSSKSTGDGKDAARIGKLIGDKVREVILQEKRNGGLLTS